MSPTIVGFLICLGIAWGVFLVGCIAFLLAALLEDRADRERLPGGLSSPEAPELAEFKPAQGRPHIAALQAKNEAAGTDWSAACDGRTP